MSINEKVLDAIELLAANSVQKAGYDKTIQAQIISCEDATIGKYRCRYQDATIYAYTNNPDITYSNGAYVYILVPGNDMRKEKTILGTTKKLGINFIPSIQGDQAYSTIGTNTITSNDVFYLDSSNKDYKYTIYKFGEIEDLNLDIVALENYIKESSSLIAGATFKTKLPPDRQFKGHYGITFNLCFSDNATNKEVIRSYTIDEDNMVDNPYRLAYETRQYQIFDIDGQNFVRVDSIEIFNKDFPNATEDITGTRLTAGDIEITALELKGAVRLSEEEINGIAISFYTPQGTYFTNESTEASSKVITAQVRIKGKLASAAQKIPFYWGIESVGVSQKSKDYCGFLGRGWKCLNAYNVISSSEDPSSTAIEWTPAKDTYVFKFQNATARNNRLKVAIVYDGKVVSKEINIQNLGNTLPIITIDSDEGTNFHYDMGHPTLTCKVNGEVQDNYIYQWGYEDNKGSFYELTETIEDNAAHRAVVAELADLEAAIAAGTKSRKVEEEHLKQLEDAISAFDFVQRVEGSRIYDVQINKITSFATFKCSVYNAESVYLGTAAITLKNSLEDEGVYSLVINNGAAVFQYDENGVAPNSKSLLSQQDIKGLSFTVYDNLGKSLDAETILSSKDSKVRWEFPIKDSLLVDQTENGDNSGTDASLTYRYYENRANLVYDIAQRYNIKKERNQIKLTVNYRGLVLTAETNFTFVKQGEPGTNGTEYVVKIVPNTLMENPPVWPVFTKADKKHLINYGLKSPESETVFSLNRPYAFFKVQLWRSGELVWEGVDNTEPSLDGLTKPDVIEWDVLKNNYETGVMDLSVFSISDKAKGLFSYVGDYLQNYINPFASIVKCTLTLQGRTYCGSLPVIIAQTSDESLRVDLTEGSGFRYVVYSSDGTRPQYNSTLPFEFICKRKRTADIEWRDISLLDGEDEISYEVLALGNYLTNGGRGIADSNLLQILTGEAYRDGCEKNQWRVRPAARYDGISVNNAVCCIYRKGEKIIGKLYVPIHFLLNRYGFSHLNNWDGNSIQLKEEGGFILSPQVGAGRKEDDNSFTGVVMGEAHQPGLEEAKVGLLGYNHGNQTFLLNSENGSAILGSQGKGQIIIDPHNQERAMLYSGNFWKEYDADGLPKSYQYRDEDYEPKGNCNKEGLLIDLTSPEIYFGTGKFYVTKDGSIHSSKGKVGGWTIQTNCIRSDVVDRKQQLVLQAPEVNEDGELCSFGQIYSGSHNSFYSGNEGFHLSHQGLSIGKKVRISSDGVLKLGPGASGSGPYWTIDGTDNDSNASISYTKGDEAKVYIGTDKISLGHDKFSVDNKGNLKATTGLIGGWSIENQVLSSTKGDVVLDSGRSQFRVYGGYAEGKFPEFDPKTGKEKTENFRRDKQGNIISHPWWIKWDGDAHFSHIQATGGTVGGWTIGENFLKGGNLRLQNDGEVEGLNWHILPNGDAWFNQIHGQVAGHGLQGLGFRLGGSVASGGGGGGTSHPAESSWINPNSIISPGIGQINPGTLAGQLKVKFDTIYAKEAEFNNLKVLNKLSFAGKSVGWAPAVVNASLKALRNPQKEIVGISLTLYRWEFLTGSIGLSNTANALTISTQYEG